MLRQKATLAEIRDDFAWDIPEHYNIGIDICDRHAAQLPDSLAIIDVGEDGTATEHSFAELRDRSNQLANVVSDLCGPNDRVGILLPQCFETAVSHIAVLKTGRISLPLFTLFGPDALAHRLADSGASLVITNKACAKTLSKIRHELPGLKHILCIEGDFDNCLCFNKLCGNAATEFEAKKTYSNDPALLIYTSGTTGNAKGALHAHRVLLGHLPGVEMSHNFFPQDGDRIWTPADWAWIGGLLDVLMPALHHRVPVVACRFRKFSAEAAFQLLRTQKIKNAFLPPTALKMMRIAVPSGDPPLYLRSVASGGETLGKELIAWGEQAFGTVINEFYGQTECNMIVSSCSAIATAEPGIMGFAVPGHVVEVLDEISRKPAIVGASGDIAVRTPDPVMFLEYWKNAEATADKFVHVDGNDWLLTGDKGVKTTSGRIAFLGRDDDIISSSGYRIGPAEIEDCLLTHPSVQMAGVVGKPDPIRGEAVTAFIFLAEGFSESKALANEIADHVKNKLATYEFPREVHFINDMPLTTTGKIIRMKLRERARHL